VLSRVIYGSRVSLIVGFAAVVVGGSARLAARDHRRLRGGRMDAIIMTIADAQLAFPFILLAIGIIAVLGPSFPTLIVVIGLSGWVSLRGASSLPGALAPLPEFVERSTRSGGSVMRSCCATSCRTCSRPSSSFATLELARSIVLEATLSFPRLGIQPPTPSWGGMIQEGRRTTLTPPGGIATVSQGLILMLTSVVVSRTGRRLARPAGPDAPRR
jgi:peptide/nickel transport system permease protein